MSWKISGRMTRKSVLDVLEPGDKVKLRLTSWEREGLREYLRGVYVGAKTKYDDSCNGKSGDSGKTLNVERDGFDRYYSLVYILALAREIVENPPELAYRVKISIDGIFLKGSEHLGGPERNIYRGSLRPYRKRMDKLIEDIALEREILKMG